MFYCPLLDDMRLKCKISLLIFEPEDMWYKFVNVDVSGFVRFIVNNECKIFHENVEISEVIRN